jgi:hypothetical protein
VLDNIHHLFVNNPKTLETLEDLERGMNDLQTTTLGKIEPMFDHLKDIKELIWDASKVRHIEMLLKLN